VITGAGRGLGRVLATAFDAAGARLGLVARSGAALDRVAGSLAGDPLVDVWICNAGVSPEVTPSARMSAAAWREIIDVNLTGTFLGARAGAARMGEGGRIIVTGSVLGDRPHGLLAAYSASKGGAHALVRALAQELGPRKITANVVALGWFDTGLGAHWRRDENRDKDVVSHTALARWGTAADLPGVYLFLASDASAYVTGTTITVDGGYSLL